MNKLLLFLITLYLFALEANANPVNNFLAPMAFKGKVTSDKGLRTQSFSALRLAQWKKVENSSLWAVISRSRGAFSSTSGLERLECTFVPDQRVKTDGMFSMAREGNHVHVRYLRGTDPILVIMLLASDLRINLDALGFGDGMRSFINLVTELRKMEYEFFKDKNEFNKNEMDRLLKYFGEAMTNINEGDLNDPIGELSFKPNYHFPRIEIDKGRLSYYIRDYPEHAKVSVPEAYRKTAIALLNYMYTYERKSDNWNTLVTEVVRRIALTALFFDFLPDNLDPVRLYPNRDKIVKSAS